MIIGVPNETQAKERRVAVTPSVAKQLIKKGHEVVVASGAGSGSDIDDDQYRETGCTILDSRDEIFSEADILLQVNGLGNTEDLDPYTENQVIIGRLGPFNASDEDLQTLSDLGITAFALELIPRISRAQSMDTNSSMASVGGYKAVMLAAERLPKMFPFEMTAAGTVQPAEVFVVGAGVAGLKAISTAHRLGASVRAYDIRPEVKEEVESLGGEFVELDLEVGDASDEEGHAREQDEEFYRKQREMMNRVVGESDVVITTAAVPGRPSPELVSEEMVDGMDPGSVIVDLAAEGGGNCELTEADEEVQYDGVTVLGPTDLPSRVSHTSSTLYANNVRNFLDNIMEDGELSIDLEDDVVDSTLLIHDGEIRNPHKEEDSDE